MFLYFNFFLLGLMFICLPDSWIDGYYYFLILGSMFAIISFAKKNNHIFLQVHVLTFALLRWLQYHGPRGV